MPWGAQINSIKAVDSTSIVSLSILIGEIAGLQPWTEKIGSPLNILGRVSDQHLTENCGISDNLLPGDVVLADRGFTVQDAASLYCAD